MAVTVAALAILACLPLPARAAVSPVDNLIAQCPPSAEVAALDADLSIAFESDPTAGSLVCRAADGSANLTRFQERVYQALRVMKALHFARPLPWTSQDLYGWFTSTIDGIRFRDVPFSFCCDPPNVIDIQASPNSSALYTNRWIAPDAALGLESLLALLVHEARHNNGQLHTCGSDDQTVSELGAWGVEFYLELWEALYSGSFLTSPELYPSYYRDQHLRIAESVFLPRICSLPNADLSLAITEPASTHVRPGRRVVYTFAAANAGPDSAADVFLYSPVPAGARFVRARASQGSCSAAGAGPIACSFGGIAAGATASARVVLRLDRPTTASVLTNGEAPGALGAHVTGPDRDADPTNNSAFFATPIRTVP